MSEAAARSLSCGGLDIGRLVLRALNPVECVLAAAVAKVLALTGPGVTLLAR